MRARGNQKTWTNELSSLLILVTVLLPWWAGCSDELTPGNSVGSQLITTALTFHDTTVGANASSTFKHALVMNGVHNLTGRFGNYLAYTALQFSLPRRDTVAILSAKLNLYGVSWFGDSASAVRFSVNPILRSWSGSTLLWDSVGAGFYGTSPIGSFNGSVTADTGLTTVTLSDTAAMRQMFLSTVTTYGMILVPDPSTNVVRSWNEFDFLSDSTSRSPSLVVVARGLSGTVDTSVYSSGDDTFAGNIDNLASDPQLIYAQSGVVYWSTLKFDVGFVPRGAIVNSAALLLERQRSTTRLTKLSTDSVVSAHAILSSTDPSSFEAAGSLGRKVDGTANTFSFELRHPVQLWINGLNNGVLIRNITLREFSSFDLYTFYNQLATDPTLRPRLHIVYATEKK